MNVQHDKILDVALGNSRKTKTWKNRPMKWSELLDRMSQTVRTTETIAEYRAMTRDQQSERKDQGGFVGGYIDMDLLKEMIEAKADTVIIAKQQFHYIAGWLDHLPPADVVPKSEVERLEKELADMLVSKETELHIPMEYLVRVRTEHPLYQAIKLEVAREIFEEIDLILFEYNIILNGESGLLARFAELKNKYTESEGKE